MEFDPLSKRVIGCAIEVHRVLGPGLLESTYRRCLARELQWNGSACVSEHPVPVEYKGVVLDCGYRIDLFGFLYSFVSFMLFVVSCVWLRPPGPHCALRVLRGFDFSRME